MMLLVIAVFPLVIAACMLVWHYVFEYKSVGKERYKTFLKYLYSESKYQWCAIMKLMLALTLVIVLIFLFLIPTLRYYHDYEYKQHEMLRESYILLLNNGDAEYKDAVYQAIIEFNQTVVSRCLEQDSVWDGVFYSRKYDWWTIGLIPSVG